MPRLKHVHIADVFQFQSEALSVHVDPIVFAGASLSISLINSNIPVLHM